METDTDSSSEPEAKSRKNIATTSYATSTDESKERVTLRNCFVRLERLDEASLEKYKHGMLCKYLYN